jgi:hypothetical protein
VWEIQKIFMFTENLLGMEYVSPQTAAKSLSRDIESSFGVESGDVKRTRGGNDDRREVMTIHEQINVRDKRREERLKKMKERQFDQPTLHQLFRVFDSTNSHVLSLTDFQTGLIAMGFIEAEGE